MLMARSAMLLWCSGNSSSSANGSCYAAEVAGHAHSCLVCRVLDREFWYVGSRLSRKASNYGLLEMSLICDLALSGSIAEMYIFIAEM